MHLNIHYLCNFNDQEELEGDFFYYLLKKEIIKLRVLDVTNESLKRVLCGEWKCSNFKGLLGNWLACQDSKDLSNEQTEDCLTFAVELLLIFAQYNFTGPFDDLDKFQQFVKDSLLFVADPFEVLKENGEEINPNVVLGEFVEMARNVLKKLLKNQEESVVSKNVHYFKT